jgi:hypothetical protein
MINDDHEGGNRLSECKLDHSHDDVKQKFEAQKGFLPSDMGHLFEVFLQKEHSQDLLNEVFHLLKKYDLASEEEKEQRNNRLYLVLNNA